jgi:DNA-directed RNA polymerase sigma subunit (sigma70/sigma32)
MSETKGERIRHTRKVVKRDTISRERVRQIQSHAMGKLRKLLFERGITKMSDLI